MEARMEGCDPDSDGGDDSVTVTDSTGDLSDLSASHYQGVMLLQKLQQLKVWVNILPRNPYLTNPGFL